MTTQNSVRSTIDIDNEEVFKHHSLLCKEIADNLLKPQKKSFVFDDDNKDVFRFLLLYFNGSEKAKDVFPHLSHTLDKHIMLVGEVGAGKTLAMKIFSEYLKVTNNQRHKFDNISVTQMINYYQKHGHIDAFTYREQGAQSFDGKPVNVCLNDVGMATHKHYGQDTKIFVEDFLHSRNEIWTMNNKFAHITTNLTPDLLSEYFNETVSTKNGQTKYVNRLRDRFKTYNIVYLAGKSRR